MADVNNNNNNNNVEPVGVFKTQRSDSTSSTGSSGSFASRGSFSSRRGSQGALFESLHQLKRSNDPASLARRQSMHEQRPPPGLFGSMWNTWVRGAPK